MAKGTSGRGSATGTPSSLTTLLSPKEAVADVTAMWQALAATEYNIGTPTRSQLRSTNFYDPIGDRRRYRPDKSIAPPHAFNRAATRLHIGQLGRSLRAISRGKLPSRVRFAVPNLIALCLRRQIRREVLHAFHRTTRGHGGGRRKRNFWSDVKC
ncbi:hypothetical protein [robinz microvirus RP_165]|nr:hypothetical protein [robinz microvirus RP_165]